MLIEAASSYRFPARISREQLIRQEKLPKPVRDIAWKAQEQLCRRYRKFGRKVTHGNNHRDRARTDRICLGYLQPSATSSSLTPSH